MSNMTLVYWNGSVSTGLNLLSGPNKPFSIAIANVYQAQLGRAPDLGGVSYWYGDYLNACNATAGCGTGINDSVHPTAFAGVENAIIFSAQTEQQKGGVYLTLTQCHADALGY